MKDISCGLVMYRHNGESVEFFLVFPGGPYFKNKDEGYWSIPKGLPEKNDDSYLEAAKREFNEETGLSAEGDFIELGEIKQKSGKTVHAWGFRTFITGEPEVKSNTCEIEFPYGSGKKMVIPEVSEGKFFDADTARLKINQAQIPLLDRLLTKIGNDN